MSNRKRLKKKPEPVVEVPYEDQPKIYLNEKNKYDIAKQFGYNVEWLNDILAAAHERGYEGISFPPVPSGR